MENLNLSKQQKILLVLFDLSGGEKKNLKFEDISVGLFIKFPKDFHMKGYEQYPDSGDSIKRPLYTFRDKGLLVVRNMIFSLTDKGLDIAQKTLNKVGDRTIKEEENFDRYVEKELKRIENLNSFKYFLNNQTASILDTDFFDYLGISVRSSRMDFKGRLNYINEIVDLLKKKNNQKYKTISDFHKYMISKFNMEISYKLNN